jgi:hypothetical protein
VLHTVCRAPVGATLERNNSVTDRWTFLIFPVAIVVVVWPIVVLGYSLFNIDISRLGGPWGVPFVLLFCLTPLYLATFALAQGLLGEYRRMRFAILAIVGWLIVAVLTVLGALAALGGHGSPSLVAEVVWGTAYTGGMAFLVLLYWFAHRRN